MKYILFWKKSQMKLNGFAGDFLKIKADHFSTPQNCGVINFFTIFIT